jgi:hypothetical protein
MYLYLPARDRSRFVYRIMSLDRLFQMFAESANYLVRPNMWQDPFENFIARLKGRLPNGELVEFAQRFDFFGQCWTLLGGTDAMWRIYSSDQRSVRVKVRVTDLYEALSATARDVPFIGRVKYVHGSDLHAWTGRVVRSTKRPSLELLAKTFLVKRMPFSHENEIRLLYCSSTDDRKSLYRHPFDCHRLIQELTLDPRLTHEEFIKLRDIVRSRTSFKGRVVQSDLYAPPLDFVLRLGPNYAALPRSKNRVWYEGDRRVSLNRTDVTPQLVLPTQGPGAQ